MRFLSILLSFFLFSCTHQATQNDEEVDSSVYLKAVQEGNRISTMAQQALSSNLMYQLNQKGPVDAVEFCNESAYAILDTLTTEFALSIKRAAIKARNSNNLPTTIERQLIVSYTESIANGKSLQPMVKTLNREEVLYAAPIITKGKLCLQCHGSVTEEINKETLTKLNNLYPDDMATGHQIGDLRGIWSIRFDTKLLMAYEADSNLIRDGLTLLKQNCYSCHNPNIENHEQVIAPPMEAVKRRYLSRFGSEEAFKSNMIEFIKEPTTAKAIMNGPVRRFGLMPKYQQSQETLDAIVDYIYSNELQQPEWFESHYQEKHQGKQQGKHQRKRDHH